MSEQKPDVDPEISEAFYGFVASNPKPTTRDGKPRLYFRAGQEHYGYGPDGSRIKLPTTFHDVVAFRGAAEAGDRKLAKGDWFLAIGHPEPSTNPKTGIEETDFIASRFGHDLARMNTHVGSPRRLSQMEPPNRQQPQRQVGFEPPEHEQPGHEQHARAM